MELLRGEDGRARCWWGTEPEIYRRYHDEEWGRPQTDDRRLFEKICLEGFQAGLSWLTILRKRDRFREVFADFDPSEVANMTGEDVDRLMRDDGIVRHRGKIESTINNARRTLELEEEDGSLAAFVWGFEPASSSPSDSKTPESVALSRALKAKGFTFVGPTTVYAFMEAVGLVNDHLEGCYVKERVDRDRSLFKRPT